MRYGSEHKQATRQRIVAAAGRRFKRDGIDGAGISVLMKDAGLTNGAFYAHFESKDDLVANAVADQLCIQRASIDEQVRDRDGLERFVREYLSVTHRDSPEEGCPSAALLDEIGRSPNLIRDAYSDGVLAIIDDIAALLAPADPQSARVRVLGGFATMVGTLQLSRALSGKELADAVLEQGIQNVLTLLGTPSHD
ncbi:TetR/AcrR family transcriptional regulator [Nocardia sp. NBC_01388]|uniref:TetR/AcrR family transcriptional regulator n=1 Tax=Nocardia sp. NBC_01388 TaxID=2903596 RepID=UPI0032521A6E